MKKRNTIFALLLALVLAVTPFAFTSKQSASAEKNYTHYYSQLGDLSKSIYEKLVDTSNADTDFSCDDRMELTGVDDEIADYFNGGSVLSDALSDAKKAISLDCPEACYIDFDKIDLIISQDSEGKAHAYIGAVRDNGYKDNDFVTQNVSVPAAISQISTLVGGLMYQVSSLNTNEKINAVHNYILENCTPTDSRQAFANNVYGVFGKGKASSLGYASAFKLVMDNIGVDCITVSGLAKVDGQMRYHSWNVVQFLNGRFIVDCALNDELDTNVYFGAGSESIGSVYYPYVALSNKIASTPQLDFAKGASTTGDVLSDLTLSAPQTMPVSDIKKPVLLEQKGFSVKEVDATDDSKIYPQVLVSKKYENAQIDGATSTQAYKISLVGDDEIDNATLSNKIKVMFPFPQEYGIVDEVSYHAYALGLNGDGTIDYTQKTLLESITTSYGIVVACNKMGVIAITAESKTQESKQVVVVTGRGGNVDCDWATLDKENVEITVTPNEGKFIESIVVNDQRLSNVVGLGHAFTLKPDECGDVTVVQITFADTQVHEQNLVAGIKTAVPVTPDFDLTVTGESNFNKGESRVLTASHNGAGDVSYRWYKDGVLVSSADSITVSEEGEYKLVVCSRVGQLSKMNTVTFSVTVNPVLTWVWILLGVLVFILLIATIGFIYVKRAGKVDDEPKEEEVVVDTKNRIADGKTAVAVSKEKKEAKIAQEIEEERKAREEEERIKEEKAHEPLPDPAKIPVDKKEAKRIKHVTSLYKKQAPWESKVNKILKKKDKEELKKDPDAKIKRAKVTSAKLSIGATRTTKIEIQPKEEKPINERVVSPVEKNNSSEGDKK